VFDDQVNGVYFDAVADIIGMLDEEEDAGAGELLDCASKGEREGHQGCGVEGHVFEEILGKECAFELVSFCRFSI
jgi:hypothetical protein